MNLTADPTTYTVQVTTGPTDKDAGAESGGVVVDAAASQGDLRWCLNQIQNSQAQGISDTWQIQFGNVTTVQLANYLPMINLFQPDQVTIGNQSGTTTIDGNGYRPFFASDGTVTLQNLTIQNAVAQGGKGGDGYQNNGGADVAGSGGGGMGAGGALFIDKAQVTLINVAMNSNQAIGGSGGILNSGYGGPGGGGGLEGNGGDGGVGSDSSNYGGAGGGGGYSGQGGVGGILSGGGGGAFSKGGNAGDAQNGGGGGGGSAIIGAEGGDGNGSNGGSVAIYVFGGGGGGGNISTLKGGDGGGLSPGTGDTGQGGGGGGYCPDNSCNSKQVCRRGCNEFAGSGGTGGGGGGGDGLNESAGGNGGIGGGGGGDGGARQGGQGGYGGGGGGGNTGGNGGAFGGGGGGGASGNFNNAGQGGFGGGGGGSFSAAGQGGFGAGGGLDSSQGVVSGGIGGASPESSSLGQAGGGAGFGGAIFINSYSNGGVGGGSLIIQSGSTTENSTQGGNNGASAGDDIFLATQSSPAVLTFAPQMNDTITLNGSISDDSKRYLPGGSYVAGNGVGASLLLNGPGTLTLAGTNAYFGSTTVAQGTLRVTGLLPQTTTLILENGTAADINSSQTIWALSNHGTEGGTLNLNADLIIDNTILPGLGTTTFKGTIQGTNGLTYRGSTNPGSVFNLLGTNTYSGGTTISSGVLAIQQSTSLGTGSLTMNDGSTLQLDSTAASVTLPGQVNMNGSVTFDTNDTGSLILAGGLGGSSTASLTKLGGGTLVLDTAHNAYSGPTMITGTLQAGNAGAFSPNSVITLASGAELDLHGFDNVIAGLNGHSGSRVNLGSAPLPGALLTIEGNNANTFDGVISGNGGLNVYGGSLTLNGLNTYTGDTHIEGATLTVNGAIQSPSIPATVIVSDTGILQGTGLIQNVINSGVVSPGDSSTSRLTVAGNYTQTSSGLLDIEVSPSQADLLKVAGTADLTGALRVTIDPGTYKKGAVYTILEAGAINNEFAPVLFVNPSHLSFTYEILEDPRVLLVFEGAVFENSPTSYNAIQVYNNLVNLGYQVGSDMDSVLVVLANQSSTMINGALDQLHPALFGAFDLVNVNTSALVTRIFENRAERMCCLRLKNPQGQGECNQKSATAWVEPFGYYMTQEGAQGQIGFNTTTEGILAGLDKKLDGVVFGVGGGWAHQHVHWKEGRGHGSINSGYFGVYTNWLVDSFFIESALVGSVDSFHAARKIHITSSVPGFANIVRTAKHDKGGFNLDGHIGLGGDFQMDTKRLNNIHLQPFLFVDYTFLFQRGYHESGADFLNLQVKQRGASMVRSEAGISVNRPFSFGSCTCFSPSFWLSGINETFLTRRDIGSAFQNETLIFNVKTYRKPIWLISPGFDLGFMFKNGSSFDLRYSAELGRKITTQKLDIRLNYNY